MLIEELAFHVSINSDIAVEAQYLAAPQRTLPVLVECSAVDYGVGHELFERCRQPQLLSEIWIVDLKAVVDSYGISLFWLSRCCGEGESGEEIHVRLAEVSRPESRDR